MLRSTKETLNCTLFIVTHFLESTIIYKLEIIISRNTKWKGRKEFISGYDQNQIIKYIINNNFLCGNRWKYSHFPFVTVTFSWFMDYCLLYSLYTGRFIFIDVWNDKKIMTQKLWIIAYDEFPLIEFFVSGKRWIWTDPYFVGNDSIFANRFCCDSGFSLLTITNDRPEEYKLISC